MEEEFKNKARISGCHNSARQLIKRAGIIATPIKINDLVGVITKDHPGIRFYGTDKLPSTVYAIAHKDGQDIDIAFNKKTSVNRQKFSVAHEFGHLYMGHVHSGASIDFDDSRVPEVEANAFAAELIMPLNLIKEDIKKFRGDTAGLIKHLAVSEEAFWWRITSTGLLNKL
ncbi:MAG: ImmA/IrrE family metallo-endopeptidase [Candidatus Saccharimonadales bacterium]